MALAKPLVLVSGKRQRLQSGDALDYQRQFTITFTGGGTSTANPDNGDLGILTCTGDTTLQIDVTNPRYSLTIAIVMDSTGSRTVTAGSNISLTGGITNLLYDTSVSATTYLKFIYSSTLSKYVLVASTYATVTYFITNVQSITTSGTTTLDSTLYVQFNITLGGSHTININAGWYDGQAITIKFKQAAAGGPYSPVFGSAIRFGGDITSYTTSTGANKQDYVGLKWNLTDAKWDFIAVNRGFG